MDIKSAKDIEKLAKICRKAGIAEIKVSADGVEFKLWDHIPVKKTSKQSKEITEDYVPIEGAPSEEDILLWSSGGIASSVLQEN